jgi:hypothetical protein
MFSRHSPGWLRLPSERVAGAEMHIWSSAVVELAAARKADARSYFFVFCSSRM